jgi:hypothetical protein
MDCGLTIMLGRLSTRMKTWLLIILAAVFLAGCGHRDPIDRVVAEASANPYFKNGPFQPVLLPETASPVEVAARALGYGDSTTNIPVLEVRKVQIYNEEYTAVLLPFGAGQRVVLLQYEKAVGRWWNRKYDF